MDNRSFLSEAVAKGHYFIEYVKPQLLIQKWSDDKNGYGNIQYVVQDIDTDDFGGVLVSLRGDEDDAELFLNWETGEWRLSDRIIPREDIPQLLLDEIGPLDVKLSVSPCCRRLWRIAIERMENAKLPATTQVLFADDFHEKQLFKYPLSF